MNLNKYYSLVKKFNQDKNLSKDSKEKFANYLVE